MGSTHQTIYMPDVRNFRTPLPPLGGAGRYRRGRSGRDLEIQRVGREATEADQGAPRVPPDADLCRSDRSG